MASSQAAIFPKQPGPALERPQTQADYMTFCQEALDDFRRLLTLPGCAGGFPRESVFPAKIEALTRLEIT